MNTLVNKTIDKIFDYAQDQGYESIFVQPQLDSTDRPTGIWQACFRQAGQTDACLELPPSLTQPILEQLKKLAGINNRQREGSFNLNLYHHPVKGTLSAVKTDQGEKLIINLKTSPALAHLLEHCGFLSQHLQQLNQALASRSGLVILTGPAGSGRSTTAYSLLQALNFPQVNIYTLEEPVKTRINSLSQVEVSGRQDINYLLRQISQQGPDLIYLSRLWPALDYNLLNSLSSSRLVLLNIPANAPHDALSQLLDWPSRKFLIPNLKLLINQRLAQQICPNCKTVYKLDHYALDDLHDHFDLDDTKFLRQADFYQGQGCEHCQHTGVWGQSGLYELLNFDEELVAHLQARGLNKNNRELLLQKIPTSLLEDAFAKAVRGRIPLSEIHRLF